MAIIPETTELTRPYWDLARQRVLATQRCRRCARIWHPPLPRCPHCHAEDLDWQPVSGLGTVYSFTVVEHPTHVALADATPYVVALVELAEGPRLVSNILRCDPTEVWIGMPVEVTFERVTEQVTLPQFAPAPS